jgi:RecA-family ATPase
MLRFANERGWFDQYEDWLAIGMALKIAFLDDGLEIWESVTIAGRYTCEDKWPTFADEDDGSRLTLDTWFKRALNEGWRVTAEEMFSDVAGTIESATAPKSYRARRVNAASLAGKHVPEREWLVPDLIPMKQVTLLYGDGATGKSLLALLLSSCAVTGIQWFGRPVKQGCVEFISAEDDGDELHRRLNDIARETGQPLERMDGLIVSSFADEDAIMAALKHGEGQLSETEFYREVVTVVSETKPVLLVLDTLADVYGGNEVVRQQVRSFIAMLRKIAIQHSCAVLVLAHPSLSGMASGKGTSGSTGWNNSVRSRLYFSRVQDEEGNEPDTDARVLRSMKANYSAAGLEILMRYHRGIFVPERLTVTGDPLMKQAKEDRIFLDLLEKATANNIRVSASTGPNYAPSVFKSDGSKAGVSKRGLKDAMDRLMSCGKIFNEAYGPPSRTAYRLAVVAPIPTPPSVRTPLHPAYNGGLERH